MYEFKFHLSK